MKKRATVVIVCVSVFIVLALLLAMENKTIVMESITDAQALWNNEKLLVIVQKRVAIQKTNRLFRNLSEVSGIAFPRPDVFLEDLIVFKIESDTARKIEQRQIGKVGTAFPLNGSIYFLRGSDPSDYPCVFRMTGSNVYRLQRPEAEAVVGSFKFESELLKREGWEKRDLYFTEGQVEYPLEWQGLKKKILLSKSRASRTAKIELVDEVSMKARTIYELSSLPRELDEEVNPTRQP